MLKTPNGKMSNNNLFLLTLVIYQSVKFVDVGPQEGYPIFFCFDSQFHRKTGPSKFKLSTFWRIYIFDQFFCEMARLIEFIFLYNTLSTLCTVRNDIKNKTHTELIKPNFLEKKLKKLCQSKM